MSGTASDAAPVAKAARFTLYGNALSPFVRKIRVLMAEKAIPYELIQLNIFAPPPWFASISPLKRIPVLRDAAAPGDGLLADLSVIAAYLERIFPAPPLFPAQSWDFARALWLEEYADTELVNRIGMEVFRPRVVSRFLGQPCDEARVQAALTESLPCCWDYLEQALGGRRFFAGDALSIADIAVASTLVNLQHAGEAVDPAQHPHLAAFAASMHARESFAAVIAQEKKMIARLNEAA